MSASSINSGEDLLLRAHLGQFLVEVRDEKNLDEIRAVFLEKFDACQPVFLPFAKDALEILNSNPQFPQHLSGRAVTNYIKTKSEIKSIMKDFIEQSERYNKL